MASEKKKITAESSKKKAARLVWKLGKGTIKVMGKGTAKTAEVSGKTLWRNRKPILGGLHGALEGGGKIGRNVQAQFRFSERVEKKRSIIVGQAATQAEIAKRFKKRTDLSKRDRDTVLDSIAVSGETLFTYALQDSVPDDILQAYESAFPDMAQTRSFQEAIESLPDGSLIGFASVLKGKLFELRYVDWLNDGNLPSGYMAALAESPTNPGWDIKVEGPDGQISQLIQAKATESTHYVHQALSQNPHIDVVATSEVAAQLMVQGMADNVIDSGMPLVEIDGDVFAALSSGEIAMDWAPPVIAIALIAFSSYRKKDLDAYQKARGFGNRGAQAYLVYLVGGAVVVGTGTVWLGVLGAIGARLFIGRGASKADQLKELSEIIKANKKAQKRMQNILEPGPFKVSVT